LKYLGKAFLIFEILNFLYYKLFTQKILSEAI